MPNGTASNYFANRDDRLTQAGGRVYERLQPDATIIAKSLEGPRDRDRVTRLLQDSVDRISEFRPGYRALLELRLEATRRPELRAVLTRRIREDIAPASGPIWSPVCPVTPPRWCCSTWP